MSDIIRGPSGSVRGYQVVNGIWVPASKRVHNLVLRSWGAIVGRLLARQGVQYGLGTLYLEFENTASPGDDVIPPAFDRSVASGLAYYEGLLTSPDRDYLRVPVTASTLSSSDETLFPDGNLLSIFAISQGTVGTHGKPFSDANNSKVFGGALVASPVLADSTQDIVFSRFYFEDPDDQIPKLAAGQIGLDWEVELQ